METPKRSAHKIWLEAKEKNLTKEETKKFLVKEGVIVKKSDQMNPTKQNTIEAIYLQSMTDFVLHFDTCKVFPKEMYFKIKKYANFLKQPLQLGFFVPCDEEGNVLEEPQMRSERNSFDEEDVDYDAQELYEYIEAKKRVLFKGFKIRDKGNFYFVERKESTLFRRVLNKNTKSTIEDLLIWGNVELTETAIKQIGL